MTNFETLRNISRLYHAGMASAEECARLIILSEPEPETRLRLAEEWLDSSAELQQLIERAQ